MLVLLLSLSLQFYNFIIIIFRFVLCFCALVFGSVWFVGQKCGIPSVYLFMEIPVRPTDRWTATLSDRLSRRPSIYPCEWGCGMSFIFAVMYIYGDLHFSVPSFFLLPPSVCCGMMWCGCCFCKHIDKIWNLSLLIYLLVPWIACSGGNFRWALRSHFLRQ